jgi:hypothetical protein
MAQATGFGLALASPGFGSDSGFSKPEPIETKLLYNFDQVFTHCDL